MKTVRAPGGTPRRKRARGDEGAALVEMAIVALFLFTMLFGIIDFGWAFMKNLDVRHGAREVGRLAAVNFDDPLLPGGTQAQRIVNAACDRMDGDANTTVFLTLQDSDSKVRVRVVQQFDSLTGFFDSVMPSTLDSTVTMRMEQAASFGSADTPPDPAAPGPYSC